jgi:hypothetical protein
MITSVSKSIHTVIRKPTTENIRHYTYICTFKLLSCDFLWCHYQLLSFRMRYYVVWWKFTDASESHTAFIFRVKEYTKQGTNKQYADSCLRLACLAWLTLWTEDRTSKLLQNVHKLLSGCMVLQLRRQYTSQSLLWEPQIQHQVLKSSWIFAFRIV